MPTPRLYLTNADRQRAYRRRQRARLQHAEATAGTVQTVPAPFTVTTADGRALLEVTEGEHGALLRLFGADHRPLVELEAHPDGGGLYLHAPHGSACAQLYAEASSGKLSLIAPDGAPILELPG